MRVEGDEWEKGARKSEKREKGVWDRVRRGRKSGRDRVKGE